MEGLNVEGIFTHFACSDEDDETPTMTQLSNFIAVLDGIEKKGVKNLLKHCANSAAVLKYGCTHFDMVRVGLALYGLEPAPGSAEGGLIPAMTMKTPITQVKTIPAGASVSYGMTFTASRETRVATVPVGYGDGYLRAYSGAAMTVRGKTSSCNRTNLYGHLYAGCDGYSRRTGGRRGCRIWSRSVYDA